MISDFQEIYEFLVNKHFKPKLHVMDNACSDVVKHFITNKKEAKIQFLEAHDHHVNAAERSIQTFKNHVVAGLLTLDKCFPLQLWYILPEQAHTSLNLILTSRINPWLLTYVSLEAEFSFDIKNPLQSCNQYNNSLFKNH